MSEKIIYYLRLATENVLNRAAFEGGQNFRRAQKEALIAYSAFLSDPTTNDEFKLRGFMDIATGVGKTAIFAAIIGESTRISREDGAPIKTLIIAPNIPLLGQNAKALRTFSPSLSDSIGFYFSGSRQLEENVTNITFDSWVQLVEKGILSGSDHDLVISDEGHRGLSDRRMKALYSNYPKTALIAFTASGRFSEEKTIAASHFNQIYRKPLVDAVKDGELCPYIHRQGYTLRVPPELLRSFTDEHEGPVPTQLKRRIKEVALIKHMVSTYRDGKNQHTGEPLSDNIAGFFMGNTAHADATAEELNDDPILQKKAKILGYAEVALAIHSSMPITEMKDRLERFKNGEAMAIVGDKKFQEGFDDPRMKVILDRPRGSLVDKIQVLGRGARKWHNPNKDDRWEGMTYCEQIVYFGSDDPEIDAKNLEYARSQVISAKEILGENPLIADCYDPPQLNPFDTNYRFQPTLTPQSEQGLSDQISANPSLFENEDFKVNMDGLRLEDIVSETEISTILEEQAIPDKSGHVYLDEDLYETICQERSRTNIAAAKLLKSGSTEIPQGLTEGEITKWIGRAKQWPLKEHIEWALTTWRSLPDAPIHEMVVLDRDTANKLVKLSSERRMGAERLMSQPDIPEGVAINLLHALTKPKGRRPHEVRKDVLSWMVRKFDSSPYVALTEGMQTALNTEMKRTNLKENEILKIVDVSSLPEMTRGTIRSLSEGKVKTVNAREFEELLKLYRNLPTAVAYTHDILSLFVEWRDETGLIGGNLKNSVLEQSGIDLGTTNRIRNIFNKDRLPKTLLRDEIVAIEWAYKKAYEQGGLQWEHDTDSNGVPRLN